MRKQKDAIGKRACLRRIVGTDDRRSSRGVDDVAAKKLAEIPRATRIQPQRRFIEQQHLRITEQSPREREALSHPARIGAKGAIRHIGKSHLVKQQRRALPR